MKNGKHAYIEIHRGAELKINQIETFLQYN